MQAAALDLALPRRCRSCEVDLHDERDATLLCGDCRRELRLVDWAVCRRCAAAIPIGESSEDCGYCRSLRLRFDRAIALGSHDGLLRNLIIRMKVDRGNVTGQLFAELVWERLQGELSALHVDAATAIPSRPNWWGRRGENGPQRFGEALARRLAVPWAPRMLAMKYGTLPQVGLTRPGRFRNIAGRMTVRRGRLKGAHVLLIDDTLTTGATCSEAARALKHAGTEQVTVLVVGRTPLDLAPAATF